MITRLLPLSNKIPFSFYANHSGRSYSTDRYLYFGKRPLAIAAMNAELPLFKVMVKIPGEIPSFHQLWFSMEHHKRVSIGNPPHSPVR